MWANPARHAHTAAHPPSCTCTPTHPHTHRERERDRHTHRSVVVVAPLSWLGAEGTVSEHTQTHTKTHTQRQRKTRAHTETHSLSGRNRQRCGSSFVSSSEIERERGPGMGYTPHPEKKRYRRSGVAPSILNVGGEMMALCSCRTSTLCCSVSPHVKGLGRSGCLHYQRRKTCDTIEAPTDLLLWKESPEHRMFLPMHALPLFMVAVAAAMKSKSSRVHCVLRSLPSPPCLWIDVFITVSGVTSLAAAIKRVWISWWCASEH